MKVMKFWKMLIVSSKDLEAGQRTDLSRFGNPFRLLHTLLGRVFYSGWYSHFQTMCRGLTVHLASRVSVIFGELSRRDELDTQT